MLFVQLPTLATALLRRLRARTIGTFSFLGFHRPYRHIVELEKLPLDFRTIGQTRYVAGRFGLLLHILFTTKPAIRAVLKRLLEGLAGYITHESVGSTDQVRDDERADHSQTHVH